MECTFQKMLDDFLLYFRQNYPDYPIEILIPLLRIRQVITAGEVAIINQHTTSLQKADILLSKIIPSKDQELHQQLIGILRSNHLTDLANRLDNGLNEVKTVVSRKPESEKALESEKASAIQLVEPPQQEFSFFKDQAKFYLSKYWPRWNDYDNPSSYIMPPIFKYMNAEVSDEAFENLLKRQEESQSVVSERVADNAEYAAFAAIEQLVQDRIRAPFLCVNGLDLRMNIISGKLHGPLTMSLPNLDWDMFKRKMQQACGRLVGNLEYDFLLIGPTIGLIVLEVNASSFGQRKHFKRGYPFLPDVYKMNLRRLDSIEALVFLLGKMSPDCPTEVPVHKVCFTPNLERSRYDDWMSSLTEVERYSVKEKIGPVQQWFHEDMVNHVEDAEKPPLYSAFKTFLTALDSSIPTEMYEAYAVTISAINVITPGENWFSSMKAIEEEHSRLQSQRLLAHDSGRLATGSVLTRAPKAITNIAPLITSDQLETWKGPVRQILCGVAGTGKSVILQAKALNLCARDEFVHIITSKSLAHYYKTFFGQYEYTQLRISYPPLTILKDACLGLEERIVITGSCDISKLVYDYIDDHLKTGNKALFAQLLSILKSGHVIIDSRFDPMDGDLVGDFLLGPILLLTLAARTYRERIVWAAIDPYDIDIFDRLHYKHDKCCMMERILRPPYGCFAATALQHVVRCSEYVFGRAYPRKAEWPAAIRPSLAHKIIGIPATVIHETFRSLKEALLGVWQGLKSVITFLVELGLSLDRVAVLVSGDFDENTKWIVGTDEEYVHQLVPVHGGREANFLYSKCQELWPVIRADSDLEMLGGENFDFDVRHGKLVIMDWHASVSMRWPVIVFVKLFHSVLGSLEQEAYEYQRYRALTRATVKVVEICVKYSREETSASSTSMAEKERLEMLSKRQLTLRSPYDPVAPLPIENVDHEATGLKGTLSNPWIHEKHILETLGPMRPANGLLNLHFQPMTSTVPECKVNHHYPKAKDHTIQSEAFEVQHSYYHNCRKPIKGFVLALDIRCDLAPNNGIDLTNIKNLFVGLEYEVIMRECLVYGDIQQSLNDFVDVMNDGDSTIVYINACAENGEFLCQHRNKSILQLMDQIINARRRKEMPVIFIIQASRKAVITTSLPSPTPEIMENVMDRLEKTEWISQANLLRCIPIVDHAFVMLTTTPAAYSWPDDRSPSGSWFTQLVCEIFAQHAHESWADLSALVTLANEKFHAIYKNQRCLLLMNFAKLGTNKTFHFFPGTQCPVCLRQDEEKLSCLIH